jgi:hypothetical protein
MQRLVLSVLAILFGAIAPAPTIAVPQPSTEVSGGGTGTFNADVDGDGDIDGSHFGMDVLLNGDASAHGYFLCLMAGDTDFLGLNLMAVEGRVHAGTVNADQTVSFSGVGTVNLGKMGSLRGVPFSVTVTGGGPGVGTLKLTVIGAFDGVPGDTITGNGNYDLPVETVSSGLINVK